MPTDLHDDDTLDELDKARAADMDECRPIYSVTISVVVTVVAKEEKPHKDSEEDLP